MEEFQAVGDALGKAITEGNIDEAINLIKKAVTLDAEFEVYLQPKNEIQAENPKKDDSLIQETYGKLLEFGVDQSKAWELANNYPNLEEALNHAF
jgi:hypothetical protein